MDLEGTPAIGGRRPHLVRALAMVTVALIGCAPSAPTRAGGGGDNSVVTSVPRPSCVRATHVREAQASDSPVSSTIACPGSSDAPGRPRRHLVEPRGGQVDLRPIAWTRARVARDDRTVTIAFASGIAPCSVLDHVDVEDRPKAVTITLFEGHAPDAGDVACIDIAQLKAVRILLERPLNGRELVDGAGR
jgi:hypothetical protein